MKKSKHNFNWIFATMLSILMFFLAFKGYRNQNINLNKVGEYEGYVASSGEIIDASHKQQVVVFYLKLEGLPETLGVYRSNKNYRDLLEKIKTKDFLKVYYKIKPNQYINTDLIQIEKDKTVVLSKSEYESNHVLSMWIGLSASVLFFSLGLYSFLQFKSDSISK